MEASDDLTLMAAILPGPAGGKIVGVVMSHFGTEEEGERAIRPIRELGSVLNGHGRAHPILRDTAAIGCVLSEGVASLLEIRVSEECH